MQRLSFYDRALRYIEAYDPHPLLQGVPYHPKEEEQVFKDHKSGFINGYRLRPMGQFPAAGVPEILHLYRR